jgi:hypothetical protein
MNFTHQKRYKLCLKFRLSVGDHYVVNFDHFQSFFEAAEVIAKIGSSINSDQDIAGPIAIKLKKFSRFSLK